MSKHPKPLLQEEKGNYGLSALVGELVKEDGVYRGHIYVCDYDCDHKGAPIVYLDGCMELRRPKDPVALGPEGYEDLVTLGSAVLFVERNRNVHIRIQPGLLRELYFNAPDDDSPPEYMQ
jgi:hypothetical protein